MNAGSIALGAIAGVTTAAFVVFGAARIIEASTRSRNLIDFSRDPGTGMVIRTGTLGLMAVVATAAIDR